MKKVIVVIALSLFSFAGIAQRAPKWTPEKGYWVVESNTHQPKNNIVYFYNDNNELIYKENVDGVVLRLHKRRVKMNMKKVLNQALLAYEAGHKTVEDGMLLATLIRK